MRLVSFRRYRLRGVGAVLPDGRIVDLRAAAVAYLTLVERDPCADGEAKLRLPPEVAAFLAGGDRSRALAEQALAFALGRGSEGGLEGEPLIWTAGEVRLAPPVAAPLIVSTGATFQDTVDGHGPAREKHTEFYLRDPHQVLGPADDIPFQRWVTRQLDAAVRLGVVIGRAVRCASWAEAREVVYGYCLINDLAAQDLHVLSWAGPLFHMQYAQGKAFHGSIVMGPAVVSRDEVADLESARARLWVDGRLVHDAPIGKAAARMIPDWIAYLSEFVTLRPGTVIILQSSAATVVGADPQLQGKPNIRHPTPVGGRWLQPGARVAVEIEGLGRTENCVCEMAATALARASSES